MRRFTLGCALLLLAGCSGRNDDEHSVATVDRSGATTVTRTTSDIRFGNAAEPSADRPARSAGRSKIIDHADVLDADAAGSLSRELAEVNRIGGPDVTLVMVRPTSGESMEQIGWAVAGRPRDDRSLVILADPHSAKVRIEGSLAPERKAALAAAMQQQLRAKQPVGAVRAVAASLRGEP